MRHFSYLLSIMHEADSLSSHLFGENKRAPAVVGAPER